MRRMMLETGNNIAFQKKNTLSIRLRLDGQSFSLSRHIQTPNIDRVVIEVDTLLTIVIPPTDGFDLKECFTLQGVNLCSADRLVCSKSVDMHYAMVVPNAACEAIKQLYPDSQIEFTSQLQRIVKKGLVFWGKRSMILTFKQDRLYFAVVERGSLLYADVLPYNCTTDVIYILGCLSEDFALHKSNVIICGDGGKSWYKEIKRYFRYTRCE